MSKINKEEYELLKGLDDKWKWIARDEAQQTYAYEYRPIKSKLRGQWESNWNDYYPLPHVWIQFIQWEDEEPYSIAELIEEYEYWQRIAQNPTVANLVGYRNGGKETEVKTLESIREEIWEEMLRLEDQRKDQWADIKYQTLREVLQKLGHLDEPEPKNITLQDVTDKLWELPSNNRKLWLARLNGEFQEGYIVPLGLKTTDGEEQYLTYNGSYFASRRNKYLQQTFATLEEIPEFYRELAERVL